MMQQAVIQANRAVSQLQLSQRCKIIEQAVWVIAFYEKMDWNQLKRKVVRSDGQSISVKKITLKLFRGFYVVILPQGTKLKIKRYGKN